MEKKVSISQTKKEILDAYHELLQKMESKTEEPKVVQKREMEEKTVKEVSRLSVDSINKNIAGLKINISGALDKLEEQMAGVFKEFEKLHESVKIERENLEELYQISANAHSLSALIAAQKEKQEVFEKEIEEKKLQWKAEEEKIQSEITEAKVISDKQRKRDEEEYQYNLKIRRTKDQDEYEEKKNKLEKELLEKKAWFEKEMAEREAKLKEAETELLELRKKDEEFPVILEKEVKKAQQETEKILKQQYDFEKQLSDNKIIGEQKLKDQTIKTLEAKIKDQETLLRQLTIKTDASEENVKQMALKALETTGKERVVTVEKKKEGE
ncbi:MAG: hypothetical protein KAX05_10405 [Bacteroidales bacterium]|nr:hypothetical protein [Bacteroidales bacterium]